MQRISTQVGGLGGRTLIESVTGETVDISEYLDFGFYDQIWYHENAGLRERLLGRWLDVSNRVGSLVLYWILTVECTFISHTTVQRVTNLERQVDEKESVFQGFDKEICRQLGKEDPQKADGDKPNPEDWAEFMEFDPDFNVEFNCIVSDDAIKKADEEFTPEVFDDTYINMELVLPRGDGSEPASARVKKQLRDANGLPIGTSNENPILDSRVYKVEYQDGHKASMTENEIAQNLFAQVDAEGNHHGLFDEIADHRTDGTDIKQQDAFLTTRTGTRCRRETTKGWDILVQ